MKEMSDDKEVAVTNEQVAARNDESARGAKEAATGVGGRRRRAQEVHVHQERGHEGRNSGVGGVSHLSRQSAKVQAARRGSGNDVERARGQRCRKGRRGRMGRVQASTKRTVGKEKGRKEERGGARRKGEGRQKTMRRTDNDEEVENKIRGLLENGGKGEDVLIKKLMASQAVRDAVMMAPPHRRINQGRRRMIQRQANFAMQQSLRCNKVCDVTKSENGEGANDTRFRERDETSAREICVVLSRSRCFEDSNSRRPRNHGWTPSPLTTRKSGGTLGNRHAKMPSSTHKTRENKQWPRMNDHDGNRRCELKKC